MAVNILFGFFLEDNEALTANGKTMNDLPKESFTIFGVDYGIF